MSKPQETPVLSFASAGEWERWLKTHHASSDGLWLQFAKKGSGIPTVTYPEAVEIALCYGWIDAQMKSLGATHYVQRFVPRRPKSVWSKRNIEKVEKLIAAGRMKPAGLAQIEAAKKDGRWARAYDSPSTSTVPPDLQAALDASPKAKKFFQSLTKANRYAMLYRLQSVKRDETRQAKIKSYIAMLKAGKTLHLFQPTKSKPA
jgi:uncharacterized protein YdeI (YjbR/CyaY-like superfamily)